MKFLGLLLIGSLAAGEAFASIECVSLQTPKARVLVLTPREIGPTTLTVQVEGKTIYSAIPLVELSQGNGVHYHAPTLKNARNAPADLFLQIYRKNGQMLGEFGEGSYLPVVPVLSLQCRQI